MLCKLFSFFSRKSKSSCNLIPKKTILKKTVLIVEDETSQRITFQKIIEKAGYRTLLAKDGEQGIIMAFEHKPDLILLDVLMPQTDGIEVCRQIKNNLSTSAIPIIFLTSQDSADDVVRHFEMGGDMHLTKPIDAKELLEQIKKTLLNTC